MHTLQGKRCAAAKPTATLLCPTTALSARYGSVFGFEALTLNPLGRWTRYAWTHAGEDDFLDFASDYAYDSMFAFQHRDDSQTMQVRLTGQRAIQKLQAAVDATAGSAKMDDNLVVAIMLHYAAEVSYFICSPAAQKLTVYAPAIC